MYTHKCQLCNTAALMKMLLRYYKWKCIKGRWRRNDENEIYTVNVTSSVGVIFIYLFIYKKWWCKEEELVFVWAIIVRRQRGVCKNGGCTWSEAWNGDEVKFGSDEGNQVWGFEMTEVGSWGHCFLYVVAQVGAEEDMKVRFLVEKAMCWQHRKQTQISSEEMIFGG